MISLNTLPLILLAFLAGCDFKEKQESGLQIIKLGAPAAKHVWIYLCGLTDDFYSQEEQSTRQTLDSLGKEINVAFLAIEPPARCKKYDNKLCWPHETPEEIIKTYQAIQQASKNYSIAGLIGFSNGGFFVNALGQYEPLGAPLISIGAGGYLCKAAFPNTLYLIIGKKDIYHWDIAHAFYEQLRAISAEVTLIEHDEGHTIPVEIVKNLLQKLKSEDSIV